MNDDKTETEMETFHRLVLEKISIEGPWFDFDGNNCECEPDGKACQGWDGDNRRCDCTNRRVSWVLSDCKTYVYAEAW